MLLNQNNFCGCTILSRRDRYGRGKVREIVFGNLIDLLMSPQNIYKQYDNIKNFFSNFEDTTKSKKNGRIPFLVSTLETEIFKMQYRYVIVYDVTIKILYHLKLNIMSHYDN